LKDPIESSIEEEEEEESLAVELDRGRLCCR